MVSGSAGKVTLLFLISRDFCELTNAVYFAQEPEFESLFLVPPFLYRVHQEGGLPVPIQPYQSISDVLRMVERVQPDIVFLFSGYLYATNGVFSIEELDQLVRALRQRRCRIVTSDPFLGLLARVDENTFRWDTHGKEKAEEHGRAFNENLIREWTQAHAILRDCPHLYGVDPRGLATTEALSFSRRDMVRPPAERVCPPAVVQALSLDPRRRRWLFVLSSEDYRPLIQYDGVPFDDLLTDQLYEAIHQDRQPVLVAPPDCIREVSLRSCPSDGLILLPLCRYDWFLSLLLDAEYAFYWNLLSNSFLVRTLNRLPVFFFDQGHMARCSPPLFERYLHCYGVAGWCPPCLSLTEPLQTDQLARRVAEQAEGMNTIAEHLRQGPSPADVVRQLLHRPLAALA